MRTAALIAALIAVAPAWAEDKLICEFQTECFEAEACDGAALKFGLVDGDTPEQSVMRTPAGRIVGRIGGDDYTSLYWIAETEAAVHLLSWGADGTARYTLHLTDGPAVMNYHGVCEIE